MPNEYQYEPCHITKTTTFNYDCDTPYSCNPFNVYLKAGVYKFECWGASGDDAETTTTTFPGGKGGYVNGIIKLNNGRNLFLYVGGKGNYTEGGYNGGGSCRFWARPGGGSSDIRLIGGEWDDPLSLASRIIVAGAGGGGNDNGVAGDAGTISGYDGAGDGSSQKCGEVVIAKGGKQDAGGEGLVPGSFGKGGSKTEEEGDVDGGGGGSGYFGGGKGGGCRPSGAGGSSFVSGHEDCIAINIPNSDGTFTMSTTSIHYSNLFFYNPIMKDGKSSFLSPNHTKETGHTGNGAIKITILSININSKFHKNSFLIVFTLIFIIL